MDDEEEEATGLFYRVKRSGLWCLMKRKRPQVCFIGLRGQGYGVKMKRKRPQVCFIGLGG
jgi:hypothetical protein